MPRPALNKFRFPHPRYWPKAIWAGCVAERERRIADEALNNESEGIRRGDILSLKLRRADEKIEELMARDIRTLIQVKKLEEERRVLRQLGHGLLVLAVDLINRLPDASQDTDTIARGRVIMGRLRQVLREESGGA